MHAPSPAESIATAPASPEHPALRYRVWAADRDPARATLAVLSGVMSNTAWFRPLAERWSAMGYRVIGVERRGSGLNEEGRGDTASAEMLLDDAQRVVEHGRAAGRALVIVGWCWGSILGVHLARRLGSAADGLALLTPALFPSAHVLERMSALQEQAAHHSPEAPVLLSPITDEMFTDGPALEGFIRRDEARWRRFSPRFLAVSTRLSFAARMRLRKLAQPIFVALAENDVTTDNERMITELSRLPEDRVCTTSLPGGHGLQFDAPQALAERLDAWARDALGV